MWSIVCDVDGKFNELISYVAYIFNNCCAATGGGAGIF